MTARPTDAELTAAMADRMIEYAAGGGMATRAQMEAHFAPEDLDRLGSAAARKAKARMERQTVARRAAGGAA